MARAIPDRWKDYIPVGQKIEGTRFIAFKVPLKEHISSTVDSDIRLDGNILLKSIPNLGIIIDLTNTHRYYDPMFFKKMGVEYAKLMIPGQDTPRRDLVNQFIKLVKKFLKNNPNNDKLIGVHCTHGVNRTGYLICNYMISQMKIEPNEAISRFAHARGHKIERINYINALHKLLASNNTQSDIKSSTRTSVSRERESRIQRIDRYDSTRLPDRYRRSGTPVAYRRNNSNSRYGNNRESTNLYDSRSKSQHYSNRRNYNKYNYQSNNRGHETVENTYQHLPEPRSDNTIRSRPALRTDYYSIRPKTVGQHSTDLQRYRYIRKTDNL